jgi:hypothetical protein
MIVGIPRSGAARTRAKAPPGGRGPDGAYTLTSFCTLVVPGGSPEETAYPGSFASLYVTLSTGAGFSESGGPDQRFVVLSL